MEGMTTSDELRGHDEDRDRSEQDRLKEKLEDVTERRNNGEKST